MTENQKLKCYFCGEDNPDVLEVHHIVPRSLGIPGTEDLTIVVCRNCHKKLHKIYDILFKHLNINTRKVPKLGKIDLKEVELKDGLVYLIIRNIELQMGRCVMVEEVLNRAKDYGLNVPETMIVLERLSYKGDIVIRDGLLATKESDNFDRLLLGFKREETKKKLSLVKDIIEKLESEEGFARLDRIIEEAKKDGLDEEETKRIIDKLLINGLIYESKENIYKLA